MIQAIHYMNCMLLTIHYILFELDDPNYTLPELYVTDYSFYTL